MKKDRGLQWRGKIPTEKERETFLKTGCEDEGEPKRGRGRPRRRRKSDE